MLEETCGRSGRAGQGLRVLLFALGLRDIRVGWLWCSPKVLCGDDQPPSPEQTLGNSTLLANLLPNYISLELALTQGDERLFCMNNKTNIHLSIS